MSTLRKGRAAEPVERLGKIDRAPDAVRVPVEADPLAGLEAHDPVALGEVVGGVLALVHADIEDEIAPHVADSERAGAELSARRRRGRGTVLSSWRPPARRRGPRGRAQSLPPPVVEAVDRAFGLAERLGDLERREADDVTEDEYLALVVRKLGERGVVKRVLRSGFRLPSWSCPSSPDCQSGSRSPIPSPGRRRRRPCRGAGVRLVVVDRGRAVGGAGVVPGSRRRERRHRQYGDTAGGDEEEDRQKVFESRMVSDRHGAKPAALRTHLVNRRSTESSKKVPVLRDSSMRPIRQPDIAFHPGKSCPGGRMGRD
jgi:hypothetical protein